MKPRKAAYDYMPTDDGRLRTAGDESFAFWRREQRLRKAAEQWFAELAGTGPTSRNFALQHKPPLRKP